MEAAAYTVTAYVTVVDDSGQTVVQNRFVLGEGTVHDLETGLMWASADNGRDINWEEAHFYCKSYSAGGFTEWRMPTLSELKELEAASEFGLFQVTSLFELSACCFWSSDYKGDVAANYFFEKNRTQWVLKVRKSYSRVIPVRDVQ